MNVDVYTDAGACGDAPAEPAPYGHLAQAVPPISKSAVSPPALKKHLWNVLIGSQLRSGPKARFHTSLGHSPQVPCPKNNQGLKARSNASVARLRKVSSCISTHRASPLCGTNLLAATQAAAFDPWAACRFGNRRSGRLVPQPGMRSGSRKLPVRCSLNIGF